MRILLSLALFAGYILAQAPQQQMLIAYGTSTPAYTGTGDVVSSWLFWYGLRAFSTADRGNALVNVCNVSDVACADLSSDATTGALVVGTIGGSSCAIVACTIKTFYDRSGNARDATQATIARRWILTANCPATGLWCAVSPTYNAANGYFGPSLTQAQQISMTVVANRTLATSGYAGLVGSASGSGVVVNGTANTIVAYANQSEVPGTASDSAWHSIQAVLDGNSSTINVDGGASTGSGAAGATGFSGAIRLLSQFGDAYEGKFTEGGAWAGTFSAGNITSLYANQHTYWGF